MQHVEIGADRDGQRVDNALAALLKGVPRSLIYRLVRKGQVRVNGKRVKPDTRLSAGDTLRVPPVRTAERDHGSHPRARARALNEAVIFEDKHFLVIDKPSGIASHGGSGVDFGVIELLRAARPDESLELVHRLDRDTSGVLVLARTPHRPDRAAGADPRGQDHQAVPGAADRAAGTGQVRRQRASAQVGPAGRRAHGAREPRTASRR